MTTDVPIAGKACGGLQLGLERGAGRIREAARLRRLRDVVPEGLSQPPSGIRRKTRRHAVSVDVRNRGHLFAVPGVAARNQIQGM